MTTLKDLIEQHIKTAQEMSGRMASLGNSEWALKWHQIAEKLIEAWKPGGKPNGHR